MDRFKQAMKVLGHLSFLFLVGISTYKTPVFARGTIQETCSDTKISLPIFIPLKALGSEMEKTFPRRIIGGRSPKYTLNRSSIRLAKKGESLQAKVALSGTAKMKILLVNLHFDINGKVTFLMNPKFKEDWSIDPHFGRDVSVSQASGLIGIVSVREITKAAIRKALDSKISRLSSYLKREGDVKKSLQKFWFALNTTHELSPHPQVWLTVTPTALATTQPVINSTGVRINLAIDAKTGFKLRSLTTSTHSVQLPTTLIIIDKPPDGHLDLAIPIPINFKTVNLLIQNQLPAIKKGEYWNLMLERAEVALAENDRLDVKATMSLDAKASMPLDSRGLATRHRFQIDASVEPTVVSTEKQVLFKDVTLSHDSGELIRKFAITYVGLTGEFVENLIQDKAYVTLVDFFGKAEDNLQLAINHYAEKLRKEKDIKITAKVSSNSRPASVDTNEHGLLVKACATTTLEIEAIALTESDF